MNNVIKFIKDYWTQIVFLIGCFVMFYKMFISYKLATMCSLRNDILEIYDRCKDSKTISRWDLEAIQHSSELYFKFKGNSFVRDIVERTKNFDIKD